MGNFLRASSRVANSGIFPDEMKYINLSENSLNVATPVASEPGPHTHSLLKICIVCVCFQKPVFVRAVHSQTPCFSVLRQKTFTVVFLQIPAVKLRERSHSGGCDEHFLRGNAAPPGSSAVSSLTPPPGNVSGRPYSWLIASP